MATFAFSFEEWTSIMDFPPYDDLFSDEVIPDAMPDTVLLGEKARSLGLTPLFNIPEVEVATEALNHYLAQPLTIYQVADILNFDLWDRHIQISILPRKQRYIICILHALEEFLSPEERLFFRDIALNLFHIHYTTYLVENSKFKRAQAAKKSEGIIKITLLELYEDFMETMKNVRSLTADQPTYR